MLLCGCFYIRCLASNLIHTMNIEWCSTLDNILLLLFFHHFIQRQRKHSKMMLNYISKLVYSSKYIHQLDFGMVLQWAKHACILLPFFDFITSLSTLIVCWNKSNQLFLFLFLLYSEIIYSYRLSFIHAYTRFLMIRSMTMKKKTDHHLFFFSFFWLLLKNHKRFQHKMQSQ